jgi:hypothetical protein
MTHPVTNTDSYSIEIPKNYKFKIENKEYKIKIKRNKNK